MDAPPYPVTWRQAFAREARRSVYGTNSTFLILAFNGLLAAALWFWLPAGWKDWLFSQTSPFALPIIIAAWMVADVPATNVFGDDPAVMLAALSDRRALRRILIAHSLWLWLLISVPCVFVAAWVSHGLGDRFAQVVLTAAVLFAPLGTVTIAMWLGTLFPYKPVRLSQRWEMRSQRRRLVRWGLLLVTPYVFVPLVAKLLYAPLILLWHVPESQWLNLNLPEADLARSLPLAAALTVLGYGLGLLVTLRLSRRPTLAAFLADDSRG